jgi:hypothetical protein
VFLGLAAAVYVGFLFKRTFEKEMGEGLGKDFGNAYQ